MPKRETETNFLEDGGPPTIRRCMMIGGESRNEATKLITLLSTRRTHIGTWNARTMYETGKMKQVAAEMKKNRPIHTGHQQNRMDTSRTEETDDKRAVAVLRTGRE
ncbi:Hypothetical predicted protein [Pelobates cultripes]|uniref:Uncharacterized protein n=1 Tax=Pelobates cultripes TaxID=61616 RepID=A0AAD1W174_PELCU|nr:Hypothetical predicted protein [Pelobates cultripes]